MTDQPLTDNEKLLPPHLGGHFGNVNKDPITLRYLADRYAVTTMLDIGCGPGGMLDDAKQLGIEAWGIDGDPYVCNGVQIVQHDYTTGSIRFWPVDLVWCTEFVEHVEAQYQDNFLITFDAGRVLFLTAAPPGFPGHHHVNCQEASYWIDLLRLRSWDLDDEATQWVRHNGAHVFSRRQGLVFTKTVPSLSPR